MKKLITIILFTLGITSNAYATCLINDETQFFTAMERVVDGSFNRTNCPDPDPDYSLHTYFEITSSIILTKPITIPAMVHFHGNMNGATPTITAKFEATAQPDGSYCIMVFGGDQVILDFVRLNAETYGPSDSSTVDTAICMKEDRGKIVRVTFTNLTNLSANGVSMTGNSNAIEESSIAVRGVGVYLGGTEGQIRKTKIEGVPFGILAAGSKPIVLDNTITGRVGIGFFGKDNIPIGQAANLFLFNQIHNTLTDWDTQPGSFRLVYGKSLDLFPSCGTCKSPTTNEMSKIPYRDDGTCPPAYATCDLKFYPLSVFKPTESEAPKKEAEEMIQKDPVNLLDAKKPEANPETNSTPPKTVPILQPQVSNEFSGGGSCSLIR